MKKFISVFLVASILLCFCSCGKSDEIDEYKKEIKELKKKVETLEKELGVSYDDLVGDESTNAAPELNGKKISFNETVTVDDVIEFSITSWEILDEIKPSNPDSVYTYIGDESGEKYIVLRGAFTNLNSEDYGVDYIIIPEITVNGNYEFSGSAKAEELDGSEFAYSTLPLEENNLILYISVSDNVAYAFEKGEVTLYVVNDPEKAGNYFDTDDEWKNTYTLTIE
jgi:hypothetical protein